MSVTMSVTLQCRKRNRISLDAFAWTQRGPLGLWRKSLGPRSQTSLERSPMSLEWVGGKAFLRRTYIATFARYGCRPLCTTPSAPPSCRRPGVSGMIRKSKPCEMLAPRRLRSSASGTSTSDLDKAFPSSTRSAETPKGIAISRGSLSSPPGNGVLTRASLYGHFGIRLARRPWGAFKRNPSCIRRGSHRTGLP